MKIIKDLKYVHLIRQPFEGYFFTYCNEEFLITGNPKEYCPAYKYNMCHKCIGAAYKDGEIDLKFRDE